MPAKIDWVWHNQLIQAFKTTPELQALIGKPVNFLEVGVFQGGGAVWLLEEVLTHADARYVGVDPFVLPFESKSCEDIKAQAQANLKTWIDQGKAVLADVPFHKFAGQMIEGLSDAIYIDGSHHAFNVLRDAAMAWDLLKVGGVMFWDDYRMEHPQYASPKTRLGVDGFVQTLPRRSCRKLQGALYAIEKTHAAVTDNDGGV